MKPFLVPIVLVATLAACHPRPQPLPHRPPVDASQCDAAGAHLAALGCSLARSPNGTPWAQVCRDFAAEGFLLRAPCVLAADTCATAERC